MLKYKVLASNLRIPFEEYQNKRCILYVNKRIQFTTFRLHDRQLYDSFEVSNVTLQYNKTFVDLEKGPFSCKRVRLKRLIFLPRIKSKENHKTANPTDIH